MEKEMKQHLDITDCNVLKGFAIICIVLHNFCHWLPGCAVENEYTFFAERTYRLIELLTQGRHVMLNIFSYAGHYGVVIFLFVSGYGLVKKYESGNGRVGVLPFIWHNVKKLWWLLVLGLPLWFASDMYLHNWHWSHHWYNVLHLLTFTGNLFPDADLLLGPWWYFSLTMQLYIIYRLFLYNRGWISLAIVTMICCGAVFYAIYTENFALLNYLRYNFVGSILPFALGITLARTNIYYDWTYASICFAMWIACWFDALSWMAAPIFFVLAVLPLVDFKGTFRNIMVRFGELSAYLFVVHPIVRPYLINNVKTGGDPYLNLTLYLFASFLLAVLYRKATDAVRKKCFI